ncbi:MAG: GH3 auxin-responsive promoter family protein, partial [Bacteroidales bacterium]|nr:GH3 auxin-responsive promoter family protein [Bacteroidales bacterium]
DRYFEENPPRYCLDEVKTGVNYALILSSNAGLWGYSIGDTVKFTSVNPYRLEVTGRLNQFTSAFGEHVIGEEVENAMNHAVKHTGAVVREFTLAPLINNPDGLPCHQWFVEFKKQPENMEEFAKKIDEAIQEYNIYYADLIRSKILRPAMIIPVPKDTFNNYMKANDKLGGQNKIPHLSNDRSFADWIMSRI